MSANPNQLLKSIPNIGNSILRIAGRLLQSCKAYMGSLIHKCNRRWYLMATLLIGYYLKLVFPFGNTDGRVTLPEVYTNG